MMDTDDAEVPFFDFYGLSVKIMFLRAFEELIADKSLLI